MKKLFVTGIAALLLVAFTMPVMAKVKIGGIIFTDSFWVDLSYKLGPVTPHLIYGTMRTKNQL